MDILHSKYIYILTRISVKAAAASIYPGYRRTSGPRAAHTGISAAAVAASPAKIVQQAYRCEFAVCKETLS